MTISKLIDSCPELTKILDNINDIDDKICIHSNSDMTTHALVFNGNKERVERFKSALLRLVLLERLE